MNWWDKAQISKKQRGRKPKNWTLHKRMKIDKKYYKPYDWYPKKKDAKQIAKMHRDEGYNVRVR